MSWREQLQEASFRGATFKVTAHSSEQAGRRVQVHEYPGRDRVWSEDLGLKTKEFSVQAYVLGADYMATRDRLVDACAKAGSGLLIHPWLGRVMVICTGCQLSERVDEGGVARLKLSFVDAGERLFPSVRNDTAKTVQLRATEALRAIEEAFKATFSVKGVPDFVSEDAPKIARAALKIIKEAGYWGGEKDYGKDMFSREDFEKLADQLKNIQGHFLLSLNDVPGVRETFSAFALEAVETTYTIGRKKESRHKVGEVIISGP